MAAHNIIRCTVPACGWGFKIKDTGETAKAYGTFRLHCISVHGLSRDDFDSSLHFDLENLTLSLHKKPPAESSEEQHQ